MAMLSGIRCLPRLKQCQLLNLAHSFRTGPRMDESKPHHRMVVGIPKEAGQNERRVGITPGMSFYLIYKKLKINIITLPYSENDSIDT